MKQSPKHTSVSAFLFSLKDSFVVSLWLKIVFVPVYFSQWDQIKCCTSGGPPSFHRGGRVKDSVYLSALMLSVYTERREHTSIEDKPTQWERERWLSQAALCASVSVNLANKDLCKWCLLWNYGSGMKVTFLAYLIVCSEGTQTHE